VKFKTTLNIKGENFTMAGLTYVCFVPAKGLIRGLSANLSNIAFEAIQQLEKSINVKE